jgi:hypothetical protein
MSNTITISQIVRALEEAIQERPECRLIPVRSIVEACGLTPDSVVSWLRTGNVRIVSLYEHDRTEPCIDRYDLVRFYRQKPSVPTATA